MNHRLTNLISNVPGWLTLKEANFLESLSIQTDEINGEIVEIGSFCGKSTICLAQSSGNVYSIDPHQGDIGEGLKFPPSLTKFKQNTKKAKVSHKIISILQTSQEASKEWNKKIRLLFIDGLHNKSKANLDFNLWSHHVPDGGIIAIHDAFLHWCGSETVAIQKIVLSSDFYKIGAVNSIVYGVKGKGSLVQNIVKTVWQVYILSFVYLNRLRIILLNSWIITKNLSFKNNLFQ